MKELNLIEKQEYLDFNEQDVIIIDKIQDMPESSTYYTEYVIVMICTSGKLQTEYDNKHITIHEGDMFLGVPGSIVSDLMISPNFDGKVLALRPSEVMGTRELHTQIINSMLYIKSNPVAHLTKTDTEEVFAYYNMICNSIRQEHHHYKNGEIRALLNAFMLKVAGIMNKNMEVPETESTVHSEQIVEMFLWMVNDDCGHNRFVEYYAERLHITPKYLSTLVRTSLDRTPSEIIKAVTIKEIERRLRYTSDSIKQISVAKNFPNTSFFGKYFKRHTGMSPNSFRNKYLK